MTMKEFEQGKQAKESGQSLEDNPYPVGSNKRRLWYEGWCEGSLLAFFASQTGRFDKTIFQA